MKLLEFTAQVQRWLVVALVAGSALLVLPPAVEPFMLPKATLIVLCSGLILALAVVRCIWVCRVELPVSVVTVCVAIFGAALLIATLTSSSPAASTVGFYSRYTGLVPYLACLAAFFATMRLAGPELARLLTRACVVALLCASAYGLLQTMGVEFLEYGYNELAGNFSLFGNINFSAAWVGAVAALCLPMLLARDEPWPWRVVAGTALPSALLYVVLVGAVQGVVAAAVGLTWAALVVGLGKGGWLRGLHDRSARAVLVGSVVLAGVLTSAAAIAFPRIVSELDASLVERRFFWAAGMDMFLDRPIFGTGLDTYAHHFLTYRPAAHAVAYGPATTDAPHSVPLGMFTNGGLILGFSYLAVVAAVGWILLTRIRRSQGTERTVLAGFGGVWLAYQAQSAVSFDVPPLAVLHWVSAGLVVAITAPPRIVPVVLPGRPVGAARRKRGKPVGPVVVPAGTWALLALVAIGATAGAWLSLYPLRADLVAASAADLTKSGQYAAAAQKFERASALNPGEASYVFLAARSYEAAGFPKRALEAASRAADRDPGTVQYALFAARQAKEMGDVPEARRWFRHAASVDPHDPPVLVEVGSFLLSSGDPPEAERLLARAARYKEEAATLILLARARLAQQDEKGARSAAERALLVDPGNTAATQLLAEQGGQPST